MAALVVLETVSIGLLAILVAGLLRSHAEILRRLHQLGAGYGDEAGPGRTGNLTTPVDLSRPRTVSAISGRSPGGGAVSVGVGRAGERTLLLFLTSGCARCQRWWEALAAGAHHDLAARVVAVGRDTDEESPALLARLAPTDLTVVQSSAAWDDYHVPGAPYAVYVGEGGTVSGEGTAGNWDQLLSLLIQAGEDGAGSARSSDQREARADHELAAAGVLPGDPSLYPLTPAPAPPSL